MKADKTQLEQQQQQLKELLKNAEYELVFEDGLIYDLQMKLTIFDIAMERTIAGGFDPLSEYERKAMCEYWYELSQNLRRALDMLNMADSTLRGFRYDIEEKGLFRNWAPLANWLNEEEKS